jgi:hypothetical protein
MRASTLKDVQQRHTLSFDAMQNLPRHVVTFVARHRDEDLRLLFLTHDLKLAANTRPQLGKVLELPAAVTRSNPDS